jgi:hypothetical protein
LYTKYERVLIKNLVREEEGEREGEERTGGGRDRISLERCCKNTETLGGGKKGDKQEYKCSASFTIFKTVIEGTQLPELAVISAQPQRRTKRIGKPKTDTELEALDV